MKNRLKIMLGILLVGSLTGCTGNFEEYNTDPYAPQEPDPTMLLPTMIDAMMYVQQNNSQMIDQMVGTLGGYFTLTNRWGGQNFDTFNPSADWNQGPYNTMFLNIYGNLFEIEELSQGSGHWMAIANLIRAAVMIRVADIYGPIPYSQVMKGLMYVPYDTNEEVYKNIIAHLQNSASTLYSYAQTYPSSKPMGSSDPIYAGDYALWARLANSLTLRVAIRTNDKESALQAIAHEAGMIETNAQNAMMSPGIQGNPYQLASVSWGDLRVNASIVDYMSGYKDPRMAAYFTKSTFPGYTDQYVGMRSGEADFDKTSVAAYSMPNLTSGTLLPVFVAAETQFLLAEAALKGWIDGGEARAREYYEAGIRLSMEQYGITDSDAVSKYLADKTLTPAGHSNDPRGSKYTYDRKTTVKIAWEGETSTEKHLEQIITQKWIANSPMGLEAWAEYRRTGYPELAPVIDNLSGGVVDSNRGMRRLAFPLSEKDQNTTNYQNAVTMIGGTDTPAVDLFWTKKN